MLKAEATVVQSKVSVWVLVLCAMVGCNKGDEERASTAQTQGGSVTAVMPARPGRSPVPTLDEWNTQRKEVTVKGSSALNCETKMVREYLRVSCRGKNDSGGTPTTVQVIRGGRGEAYTFAAGGITSLVVPFVEGIDMAATFSWTDKSHTLTLKWARGAPQPVIIGVFEGAKSPLDGTATPSADKLCACHKKVYNKATCDDLMGAPNADCERTYGSSCEMLLACSRGEPSAMPKCQPGYINAFTGYCYKECGPGKPPCPSNLSCENSGGPSICIEL